MNFKFWCVLPDGRENSLDTNNLYEAPRRARALGAIRCFGLNPSTRKRFELTI